MRHATRVLLAPWFIVACVYANDGDWHFTRIGQIGGACMACDVQGGYAYIGEGPNFVVLNLANPSLPSEVSRLLLEDTITDVAVSGNFAIVADSSGYYGLTGHVTIIDIADPANPTILRVYETDSRTTSVAAFGGYAMFIRDPFTVITVNLLGPSGPEPVAATGVSYARDVAASGNLALVAENGIVQIISMSDISAPVLRGNVPSYAEEVCLDGTVGIFYTSSGAHVIDVSDPVHPTQVSKLTDGYITAGAMGSGIVYLSVFSTIHAYSITDPAHPVDLGSFWDNRLYEALQFSLSYPYLFVADYTQGMAVINIANPAQISLRGLHATPLVANSISARNGQVCAGTNSNGTFFIDASDGQHPTIVSHQGVPGSCLDSAWRNQYIYSACGDRVVVSKLENDTYSQVATFYSTSASQIELNGQRAYVMNPYYNLAVCDISLADQPQLMGKAPMTEHSYQFALTREHAYVPIAPANIQIFDVHDPINPTLAKTLETPSRVYAMVATGNHAFASLDNGDIDVYRLTDPEQPTLSGFTSFDRAPMRLRIFANTLLQMSSADSMYAADISNPELPETIGAYAHPVMDAAVENNVFYVAAGARGVEILQYSGPNPGLPAPTRLTASDSTEKNAVIVAWDRMAGAIDYSVLRAESNDTAQATEIGVVDGTQFSDTQVDTSSTHYYWVRARFAEGYSPLSNADAGTGIPAPMLAVSPTQLTLRHVHGNSEIKLSNLGIGDMQWTAAIVSGGWLSLSRGAGTNDATIKLTYSSNNSNIDRTATVQFTAEEASNTTQIVQVRQLPRGSLTLNSPGEGDTWGRSKKHKVAWTYTPDVGPKIRVELRQFGQLIGVLRTVSANKGKVSVRVPANAPAGPGYSIRIVSTIDEGLRSDSGWLSIR